ncbi:MAG: hypothetical protein OEZ39_00260 [Gammaproteobacteria bacterium]|nr:hypothetical protein [Gammaproteobacteria bacterium]MDH5650280.1 hypothetical protein [Gammaproteobacteria bacterium]
MLRTRRFATAFIAALCLIGSAQAVEVPTTDEVRKVLDFYYQGQGLGVVLIDSKMCSEIGKEGDLKNECVGELTAIKKDESINMWFAFLIPNGTEKQKILIQFETGGLTRMVKEIEATGSIRYRTWRKVDFDRAGEWTASIFLDSPAGTKKIGSRSFTVN